MDFGSWEITIVWDVAKKVFFMFSLSKLVCIVSVRDGESGPFDHQLFFFKLSLVSSFGGVRLDLGIFEMYLRLI